MDNKRSQMIGPFLLGEDEEQQTEANTTTINLQNGSRLSIVCTIDGGTDGSDPTDTPVGTWELYISAGDEWPFVRIEEAETGDFSLEGILPDANNHVAGAANFVDVGGARAQIRYVWGSGGATARCHLYATVS